MASPPEPPEEVRYSLDEALTLLAVLEDARDALIDSRHLAVVVAGRSRFDCSAVDLVSKTLREAPMAAEPLRASEAARVLEIPTRDLLVLIRDRKIRYVMVDGIAHVPVDAIEEYRAKAS